jgi:hypothetical protein
MKRILLLAFMCLFATTAFAQKNALGLHVGNGAEIQYDRYFQSGNALRTNVGLFGFDGRLYASCIYDWQCCNWTDWTPSAGDWFLHAGVGGAIGYCKTSKRGEGLSIGVTGNVVFGIKFNKTPITLAVDYRPTAIAINKDWRDGWFNLGLSCVYRF